MCYWTGTSVFSMWQNQLLGSFGLLRLRAFYSMNTLTCFGKDIVLIKASDFCFYSLMKPFTSTPWIFLHLAQIRDEQMQAFLNSCIHICIYMYTYTHTYIQVHGCVHVRMFYCAENSVSIKLVSLCHHFYYCFKISALTGIKCRNSIPVPSLPEPVRHKSMQKKPNNSSYSLSLRLLQNNCTSCYIFYLSKSIDSNIITFFHLKDIFIVVW